MVIPRLRQKKPNNWLMLTLVLVLEEIVGCVKKPLKKLLSAVDGVTKAVWDVDKKKIDVSFDDTKTNEMAIHHAIAASGYDTEKVTGDLEAYNNLPGCCQYDHEMVMNQMK